MTNAATLASLAVSGALSADSSGNVGIGTSSPGAKLDVVGIATVRNNSAAFNTTPNTNYGLNFQASSSGVTYITSYSSGGNTDIAFATNSGGGAAAERVRIDSSGNVGIGTSSPATKLEVNGAIQLSTTNQIQFFTSNYYIRASTGLEIAANDFTRFLTGGSERARIDTSGNLLVNTTTANARATFKEAVNWVISTERTGTIAEGHIRFTNANGIVGSVQTSGSSTSYNTSSDYRLKHDIAPMTGALAKVAALNPVTYKWNADDSAGEGFIAHELQAVVPDCVTGEKDAIDADGNPVYQGIDTSFLVATLTAAIQEQQQMIETLQAKVAALEAQ